MKLCGNKDQGEDYVIVIIVVVVIIIIVVVIIIIIIIIVFIIIIIIVVVVDIIIVVVVMVVTTTTTTTPPPPPPPPSPPPPPPWLRLTLYTTPGTQPYQPEHNPAALTHTTEHRGSVVCVYAAGLCAGRLGCEEGHPCWFNKPVSQIWALLVACRELALGYNTLPKLLYVFERKM